jgi:hypothetical protein
LVYDGDVLDDVGFDLNTFDHGIAGSQERYIQLLGSIGVNYENIDDFDAVYTSTYLENTYSYASPKNFVTPYTSSFNVMKNAFSGQSNVYLISGKATPVYGSATLNTSVSGQYSFETFKYNDIIYTYAYDGNGIVTKNLALKVPIMVDNYSQGLAKQSKMRTIIGYVNELIDQVGYRDVPIYSDPIPLGINPMSVNIFGSGDGIYSDYYYTAYERFETKQSTVGITTRSAKNRLEYAPSRARQRYRWVNAGTTIITPYYIFNQFPFRYQRQLAEVKNKDGIVINGTRNIISLSQKGRPMPSVDKMPMNIMPKESIIQVNYSTFKFGLGGEDGGTINLRISYERRKSHFMYDGSIPADTYVNYVNQSGHTEHQGPIISYFNGTDINPEFTKNNTYATDNSGNRTPLRDLIQ